AAQAGQHADDDPQDHADEHQQQVERGQRDPEPLQQRVDFLHSASLSRRGPPGGLIRRHSAQLSPNAASSGPLGRGTENHISKIRKNATLTPIATGAILTHEYLPKCHMKYAMYRVEAR